MLKKSKYPLYFFRHINRWVDYFSNVLYFIKDERQGPDSQQNISSLEQRRSSTRRVPFIF